jgi:uncharacterized membrane protein (UPF0127 family)
MVRSPEYHRRPPAALAGVLLAVVGPLAVVGCSDDGAGSVASAGGGSTVAAASTVPTGVATTGSTEVPAATDGSAVPPDAPTIDPGATSAAAGSPSDVGPSTGASDTTATVGAVGTTRPAWAQPFGEDDVTVGGKALRVLVADTVDLRVQGLRDVASLAPYDGMLFVFDEPTRTRFTMSDTLIPLSIGFYGSDGAVVGSLEMVPCTGDENACPLYDIGESFRFALETAAGDLPEGPLVR